MKDDRVDFIARVLAISIFVVLMFVGTAMGEVSRDGVVAEWHFDGDAKDTSGNGNDGTIYGATWVDGKLGKALSFDGVDDYVEVLDSASLDITDKITIEAWIKPNHIQSTDYPTIFSKHIGISPGAQYQMGLGKNGIGYKIRFCSEPSVGDPCPVGNADIELSEWNHLAITFDGNKVRYYLDGIIDTEFNMDGPLPHYTANIAIGAAPHKRWYFKGIIDEVRIYNRALSEEEIKEHYESGPTTLSLTKTASPQSIKQGQTATITLSIKNTGSTEITDIEVADTIPAELTFVSGESSKNYAFLKPGDSRDVQYALQLNEAGTFNLEPAIATYADDEGNYHTAKSDTTSVAVISSVPTPTPTPTQKDSDGDGWSDEQERAAGTNPNKADSDGDGIWDSKDSNPLVAEASEQKQAVESNINVENTNTNEDSGIEPLYIGIGAIVILLIGIIAISSSRRGKTYAPININIGKVDSPDHIVNDHSTTTNVDNRDGVMQRSNIGTGAGGDVAEKKCPTCGTVAERNGKFCNECGGKL